MVTPLCPYYGVCGGCSTQHISYEQQVEQKKQALARVVDLAEITVFTEKPYFYRNRMDLQFYPGGIGLRKKGHGDILPIERCVIAEEPLNKLLAVLRDFFNRQSPVKGAYSSVILRCTSLKETALCFVLHENSPKRQEALSQIEQFASSAAVNGVDTIIVSFSSSDAFSEEFLVIKGEPVLQETFLGKTFFFPVQGFFQNNHALAEQMHQYCRKLLQQHDTLGGHLLDLYAGVGTFGIINADLFQSVAIVENMPLSIKAAERNAAVNSVKNSKFYPLDTGKFLKASLQKGSFLKGSSSCPVFVIADPPRIGLEEKAIQHLVQMQPEAIIYISCNIQRLAKELPKFKGYQVKSAALFDFFPQTPHSEAVVELVRKKG